jgi:hypothetical protein
MDCSAHWTKVTQKPLDWADYNALLAVQVQGEGR